jgi:hypothetical protein
VHLPLADFSQHLELLEFYSIPTQFNSYTSHDH